MNKLKLILAICAILSTMVMTGCESDPSTDPSPATQTQSQGETKRNPQQRGEEFTWTTPFTATSDAIVTASEATGDAVVGFFTGEWLDDEPEIEEQRTLGETDTTPASTASADTTQDNPDKQEPKQDTQPALTTAQRERGPIRYRRETRSNPRPMVLHLVEVDMSDPRVQLVSAVSEDPDGNGRADAILMPPSELAMANDLEVAVNANAFWPLPNPDGSTDRHWFTGRPIDVMGMAVSDNMLRSAGRAGFDTLWIDGERKLHLSPGGDTLDDSEMVMAVSGFSTLLRDGQIVASSDSTTIAPQLAVGFDSQSSRLVMVLIEGRQPLLSEGAAAIEMAQFLQSMGCNDALSLDAGSSVMLLKRDTGGYDLFNRSLVNADQRGAYTRPVPVLLGIRTVELSPH